MNTDGKSRFNRYGLLAAVFLGLVAMLVFGTSAGAGEKAAATAGLPILSASEIDYPPFCFADAKGRADGFSVELLRAALAAMGRDVTFRIGPWTEVRGLLERGDVQALPLVGRTPERESIFDFTFPYMSLHGAIVVREGTTDIGDLVDLKGRRVAVMKGDNAEEFLRREDRGIVIHTTATFEEALSELSEGRFDAVVIQRLVALRLIQETGIENLRVVNKPIEGFRQDFCFAVQEGDSETLALLNEGLALIMTDGTHRQLHAKWFAALELPTHRRIVVGGDHNYPPYEYLDENGSPAGFTVELTRAIAREVGLDIEIRLGPWTNIVQRLEKGEIDVIEGMFYSPVRDLKFDFTQPYLMNHYVGVARKGEGAPPASVGELKGKRIVVQQGDYIHDFLKENGLGAQLSVVETQEDVLRELAEGKYDCALALRISALHLIEKRGWTNLNLGRRPIFSTEYCYAVLNNHKALLASFGEGLKILEETGEYRRIHEKWLGLYEQKPPSLISALRYSAMVLGPLLLILLAVFLWSWSLRKQVAIRTAALKDEAMRRRILVDQSRDGIVVLDQDGKLYEANQRYCDMLGYSADEISQLYMWDWDDQWTREQSLDMLRSVDEGGDFFETRHRRKDGTYFDVEISSNGAVIGGEKLVFCICRDVTARKQTEMELQQRQAMLARTEGIAHIGSWEWDLTTATVLWSDEFFRIVQRDPARGAPSFEEHAEHFHPDDMAQLREALEATVARGEPYELELRVLLADGTVRHCLARGYPETGTDGTIARLHGSLQDITELKLTQKRVEHLNHVLRAIRDVNQLIVRERNRDTLIREACRLLVKNRGYSSALIMLTDETDRPVSWAGEGLGANFESLHAVLEQGELPPCCDHARLVEKGVLVEDRHAICGQCPIVPECVETDSLCIRLVHDGAAFGYLVATVEHDLGVDHEERSLFVEIAEDLAYALNVLNMDEAREKYESERKLLEAQLRQAQKMEAIGTLAGGIAHDFNNILGIIFGYAQMAQMEISGPGASAMRDNLEEIVKAAGRARDLVKQILAFARQSEHQRSPVQVGLIVNESLKLLRASIPTTIDIQKTIAANTYPVVADPTQIHQLMFNLCTNAAHAMSKEGGILRIRLENVELDFAQASNHLNLHAGSYVKLSIEDTGCGIDPTLLDRIFDPYFTTKEVGKGTGMGLAVVHGIVMSYGGRITVDSRINQGTTFNIFLPAADAEAFKQAEVEEALPTGSEKILFVDDEYSLVQLGKLMLTRLGYRVETEINPMRALELFKSDPESFDLVISDMTMPAMTGDKLAKELLAIRPDIPIIICTGYSEKIDRDKARAAGISEYVEKPVGQQEISELVRKLLDEAKGKAANR